MATMTKSAAASMATPTPGQEHKLSGLTCGEDIPAVCPCYINPSDGLVYRSNGTAANAAAKVRGWSAISQKSGQPITLWFDVQMNYSDALLTPGTDYYVSATAGAIDDAATTGGTSAIAFSIDAYRILVKRSSY